MDRRSACLQGVVVAITFAMCCARVAMHVRSVVVPDITHSHCCDVTNPATHQPAALLLVLHVRYNVGFNFIVLCAQAARTPVRPHGTRASLTPQRRHHLASVSYDTAASSMTSSSFLFVRRRHRDIVAMLTQYHPTPPLLAYRILSFLNSVRR